MLCMRKTTRNPSLRTPELLVLRRRARDASGQRGRRAEVAEEFEEDQEGQDGSLHSLIMVVSIFRWERVGSYHSFRGYCMSSGSGSLDGILCLLARFASAHVMVRVVIAFIKHQFELHMYLLLIGLLCMMCDRVFVKTTTFRLFFT